MNLASQVPYPLTTHSSTDHCTAVLQSLESATRGMHTSAKTCEPCCRLLLKTIWPVNPPFGPRRIDWWQTPFVTETVWDSHVSGYLLPWVFLGRPCIFQTWRVYIISHWTWSQSPPLLAQKPIFATPLCRFLVRESLHNLSNAQCAKPSFQRLNDRCTSICSTCCVTRFLYLSTI